MVQEFRVEDIVTPEAHSESWAALKSTRPQGHFILPSGEGYWGPNMTSKAGYFACINPLLASPELFRPIGERPVFLDLGSGTGLPVILAARQGWKAVGVEANEKCFRASQDNLTRAFLTGEFELTNIPRLLFGSYFPNGFDAQRFPDDPDRDPWAAQGISQALDQNAMRVNYSDAGIELGEVDLFYHFQWDNLDNLLGLFSRYAKPGAILGLCGDGRKDDYERVPSNIEYLPSSFSEWVNFHYYRRS